jgi:hypothetical protein
MIEFEPQEVLPLNPVNAASRQFQSVSQTPCQGAFSATHRSKDQDGVIQQKY